MTNGLLIGRWQTLHEGHDWLVEQVRQLGHTPLLAVRRTVISPQDPLNATERYWAVRERYPDVEAIIIPDIAGVYYGRDVGYEVKELVPPDVIRAISGRKLRAQDPHQTTAP